MASRTRARINNLNDRAREVGAAGFLTLEDIDALKAFYDFTCLKCGAKPAISPDHVKPLAAGGENTVENLQLLCETCNKGKGDEEIDYRGGKVLTPDLVPQFAKSTQESTKKNYKTNDWFKVENEYITTNASQRDLAEKYEIAAGEIGEYASKHNWLEKREQFQSETRAKMLDLVAQARAAETIAGIDLCDSIITAFMREMAQGKAKITAFDAMAAARFREVLRGGVDSRSEAVVKDWRDFARDAGLDEEEVYAEFDRIVAERARQVVDGRGAFGSRAQEDAGAGWTD